MSINLVAQHQPPGKKETQNTQRIYLLYPGQNNYFSNFCKDEQSRNTVLQTHKKLSVFRMCKNGLNV